MPGYKDYGYANGTYSHVHRYILQPLLDILSKKDNRLILDIGCGNGWLCNHLIKLGYNAYGIDASESGITVARQDNPERFFLQEIMDNELPKALNGIPFNTIISTEVIEHLYGPRDYFSMCRNILRKAGGGELIITTPYHGYLKNLALSLSGRMDKHFTVLWDGGHIKFWSKKTLFHVLEEQGFTNIQFVGCGRIPWLWKSMMIQASIQNK
jgi:2-polyprenyl-3-methyl-5-hydroxy-6-metoxy-1,4-benzoquinol methylase